MVNGWLVSVNKTRTSGFIMGISFQNNTFIKKHFRERLWDCDQYWGKLFANRLESSSSSQMGNRAQLCPLVMQPYALRGGCGSMCPPAFCFALPAFRMWLPPAWPEFLFVWGKWVLGQKYPLAEAWLWHQLCVYATGGVAMTPPLSQLEKWCHGLNFLTSPGPPCTSFHLSLSRYPQCQRKKLSPPQDIQKKVMPMLCQH